MGDDFIQVYDLRRDREYVERIQQNTVTGGDFALVRDFGLLGSDSWWKAIRDGELPRVDLDGVISRVYVNDANWPEFEVERDGELSTWALEGDAKRYARGKRARIQYVMQRYATPPPGGDVETQIVVGIWLEQ